MLAEGPTTQVSLAGRVLLIELILGLTRLFFPVTLAAPLPRYPHCLHT